jgi:hypothetical protein
MQNLVTARDGVEYNVMMIISGLFDALANRVKRSRRGVKRAALSKLFFRLFLFFTGVAILMEVLDLHLFGKIRAAISRISVGFRNR